MVCKRYSLFCFGFFFKRGIQKALRTLFFDFFFRGAMIFPPRLIRRHDSFPIVCFFFFSPWDIIFHTVALCLLAVSTRARWRVRNAIRPTEVLRNDGIFFFHSVRHLVPTSIFFFSVDSSSFLKSDVRNDSIMAHNEHTTTNTSAFSRLFFFPFSNVLPRPYSLNANLFV